MPFKELAREKGYTLRAIAQGVGANEAYLSQINTGRRRASIELCERIEKFTKGKVTRRHLRPDWYGKKR